MAGWLSPYRVIDLTDDGALIAGQMLAKLGAEVIQVEPPDGADARRMGPFDDDGRSLFWSAYAAGKRGVVLDLETPSGRARLDALLAGADIVFESFAPARRAALGLDPDDLRSRHPHLVHVSITPFGSTGPKRDWAATDLTLWAAAGPLHIHRDCEGPPLRMSVPQAWLHGGADAAGAALIALLARERTGRGQHADISVQQSVTPTTLSNIVAQAIGHEGYNLFPPPPARPPGPDGARPLRGPKWAVADGLAELLVGGGPVGGPRSNLLFDWMRAEGALPDRFAGWDWTTLPMRPLPGDEHEEPVAAAREAIAAFLAPKTKAEVERAAIERRLLLAPVKTMTDLLASEQLAHRDYFVIVEEAGARRTLPGRFAVGPADMFAPPRPAPALGEHDADMTAPRPARRAPPQPSATPPAPFAGLKVLDLAWVVAGPAIGRVLADFGATVVRVESSARIETARLMGPFWNAQPDPQRCGLYDTYNTGKLGLALDLARAEGQQVARDLAGWADVLVESFVPGQMRRWNLDPDALRAANPGLVGVSTSLMGQTGPAASFAGYGNLGAAMAGFQGVVGRPGQPPVGPYGPYTDFIGPRFGLVALLAALDRRRRTGEGCWLDVSQAEAGIQFLAPQVAEAAATGRDAGALGNRDPRWSPHGVFPCAGTDDWVALAVRDDDEWMRLAALIGGEAADPALATVAGRKAQEDRLETLIEAWTRQRRLGDVEAELQALGIPAHRAATGADMILCPHLAHRGHFVRMPHPLGGETVFEASRLALSDTPPAYRRAAPHFGRDQHEVLSGLLGYDAARIAELEAAGVLR